MSAHRSMPDPRVLVVMPALNERGSIAAVIGEVRAERPEVDILVVDDGSSDGTARAAAQAGALVCRLPFNLGVGGAMRVAYKFAQQNDYDVVVQIDADGQHDPRYLGALLARLESADLVIGARFAGAGDYRVAAPRRLAMRVLAAVLSRLAAEDLSDVTSGFRAANRAAIDRFALHYPAEYLGDTVESLVIAVRTGCTVVQEPVVMRERAFGLSSQSTIRATLYLARAVAALALAMVRQWPLPEPKVLGELPATQQPA